jgi:hypothetical protein
MAKPKHEFHQPAAEWLPAEGALGAVAGVRRKILARDPVTGVYTSLTRFEAGVDTSPAGPARHDYWEEVYILEGELTDLALGQTFRQGMYACRPPGMPHGPWRSESGALTLDIGYYARPDPGS